MDGIGFVIMIAVFVISAINNGNKRKKEQEQRARSAQQAYSATNTRAVREPTTIERELNERHSPSQQAYGEGYSTWGNTPSGGLPPREKIEQQTLLQGQSNWDTTPSGSMPKADALPQGHSAWGTTPSGSLPPRNDEERKRRESAAAAAQRAEALRRERLERAARSKAQHDKYPSLEGTSAYGQEGISVEGSSLNTKLNRHKLEASSITGHAHTENSLFGNAENCDDYAIRSDTTGQQTSPIPAMLQSLSFQNEDIVKGFIFGEILSKPKAMRH